MDAKINEIYYLAEQESVKRYALRVKKEQKSKGGEPVIVDSDGDSVTKKSKKEVIEEILEREYNIRF